MARVFAEIDYSSLPGDDFYFVVFSEAENGRSRIPPYRQRCRDFDVGDDAGVIAVLLVNPLHPHTLHFGLWTTRVARMS